MRPKNTSERASRHPPAINEHPAENDTMLMGFEFFDQTGRLNPRKILFTEKTCPNKTQRVLSHLFGRIMKWNACRWAENFLKNAHINQAALPENTKQQFTSLLHDIRKDGVVSMPRLFSFVASVSNETKASDQRDQQINSPRTGHRVALSSTPFLINHEEITQQFQYQGVENDRNAVSAIETVANDTAADTTHLLEACQIIETQWEELSKIKNGDLAPPQFKLPVKSGFLDYCRQKLVKKTEEQATEQAICSNLFADMDEKEWSTYQNIMTVPQYQAWTSKRNEWLAPISKLAQPHSEKQPIKRDLRHELNTAQHFFPAETELTVAEAILKFSTDFMVTSHGRGLLPLPVQEILDSGFITYCDIGVAAFEHIDIDVLEEFLKKYQEKWDVFGKILTPSQFADLKKHRDKVSQDIADFRANHPSTVDTSTVNIDEENDLRQTDINDIKQDTENVEGLFSGTKIISLEYLNQIEWDSIGIHLKINIDDAKKLRNYFSSAEPNQVNLEICKKIEGIARKIRQSNVSENRSFRDEGDSNLRDTGDVLAEIYGNYLRRHTSATQVRKKASAIKKPSKKTKPEKKISSERKTPPEKYIKSRKKIDTQKSTEKPIVKEAKTPAQEARKQIKEANNLIKRINEKMQNSQKSQVPTDVNHPPTNPSPEKAPPYTQTG